jgi:saxitoxin biosynthesis operon SxtJ-like protein
MVDQTMATETRHDVHERFDGEETVAGASDRSFGVVIGVALLVFGLWPLVRADRPRSSMLALGVLFILIAVTRPRLLARLNQAWTHLGFLLHRIVSPVVLGLLFYTTLTPIAVILRALGKDVLRLKSDRTLSTYWILRVPPGPPPDTMRRQF